MSYTERNTAHTAKDNGMKQQDVFEGMCDKSPKLKWIEKHGLLFDFDKDGDGCAYMCWQKEIGESIIDVHEAHGDLVFGYGRTQDEAMCDWAQRFKIKLWNEE